MKSMKLLTLASSAAQDEIIKWRLVFRKPIPQLGAYKLLILHAEFCRRQWSFSVLDHELRMEWANETFRV